MHIYILFKKSKITLHLKRSYMFRSHDHLQAAFIVPCWSYNLKHSVNYLVMLTLVLWQHVVFLCVSRTLFRMSLVMVVRRMLCSVRLARYGLCRTLCSVRLAHFGCASYVVQRETGLLWLCVIWCVVWESQEILKNPQISNLMKICPVVAKLFHTKRQRETWKEAD